MSVERLIEKVRRFQASTGEDALLVALDDGDENLTGIHLVGWTPHGGLTVDGRPATLSFYQELQGWHALQEPPEVLH